MQKDALVLVTGATGFVGSYLVRLLLKKGYKVRALRRKSSNLALIEDVADKVQWAEADITDLGALEDAFEGVTHVCHCAAVVSFHPKDGDKMLKINVEGTKNIVNLCLDFGVKKLVHVSSIAALGRAANRPHLDESCKWVESKANSRYALSKYGAEMEVQRGVAEGLPAAIVSPSVIVGSQYWDEGMAGFFRKIDEGLKFCPNGGSGFVDIRDVVRFMVLLLESDISGERYILNSENLSHRQFFGMIAKELGVPPPPITVGPFLAEVAWRVEWLKEKILGTTPLATKESARASVTTYTYGNEKSRSVFGFEYLTMEQTVRDTAKQYLEAKGEGYGVRFLN
ncbi:MAG: SDR family NAD(P)-dependent oxidoreductase [Saprospiraceae bacterium]|nr:SDR family NAD(P)-dependent oxidoreductase [Lewinellaceae bacterium]MBP6809913.1 SDR family NAD(P)-dependent oxidoreductase [Saprospiraceae bacterium]